MKVEHGLVSSSQTAELQSTSICFNERRFALYFVYCCCRTYHHVRIVRWALKNGHFLYWLSAYACYNNAQYQSQYLSKPHKTQVYLKLKLFASLWGVTVEY